MGEIDARGIALICDSAGTIVEVIRDDLGSASPVRIGEPFLMMIASDGQNEARGFLHDLSDRRASFNWQLPLASPSSTRLYFAGGVYEDQLLIVGAPSRSGVALFYEELVRMNNEQTNRLRIALKEQAMQSRQLEARDAEVYAIYQELASLNNELATTQRELARTNHELARLNEQKNQFLGIAAHDLRTPLAIILSYSEFLQSEAFDRLDEEHRRFVDQIRKSSEFMLRLVNDFLDLSTVESGRLELQRTTSDVGEIVAETIGLLRPLAEKRGISIDVTLAEELPRASIDRHRIEQTLNNLVGNAIRYSPESGTIDVSTRQVDGSVEIVVEDRGPGIPAEELERIFQPYKQGSTRATRGGKGTGLGLAIVRRIAEAHGGNVHAEQRDGGGARFILAIPVADRHA